MPESNENRDQTIRTLRPAGGPFLTRHPFRPQTLTKGIFTMSRLKSMFAAAVVVAIVALAPMSQGATVTVKAVIAGSSAMWQSMALAAYNGNGTQGNCITGFTAPCFHYTAGGFQLNDTRPVARGGSAVVDSGATIWIVWDSHTTTAGSVPNVIAYAKVDSVVG